MTIATKGAKFMFEIIRRIGAITRLIQIDSNQHFKEQKLNNNLFIYIIRTVEQPGMFLGELADSMQIDRTTSFRTVKKLIEMGYLELENDTENRKIKRVYPTQRAKQIYPELHSYEQVKSDNLLSALTEDEREQLRQLLNKLTV
ncbi:MarR family transcriptional regulator [Paucilactobacillus suebicus DSM 5007 = KCTC 3549]|uniref:MarR family transcriptional regulator n=2 Tax=Paucilactobacillus suebicus TaxID=152335 RepID=A0A0R1W3W5_9LACO|nr:MarR family transcriptional regulator [Paucilactobacillus suebicus DSM 5007 = KCTC 3549]